MFENHPDVVERRSIFHPFLNRLFLPCGGNDDINDSKILEWSLLSYNILADCYVRPKYFPYCPSEYLSWDYRKQLIMNEIIMSKADIICLQECDEVAMFDFIEPQLQKLGFIGYYTPKASRSEGVAIFFRSHILSNAAGEEMKTVFKLRGTYPIQLSELADEYYQNLPSENKEALNADYKWWFRHLESAGGVGLAILLEHEVTGQHLWVATAHLFWDPQTPEIKTAQCSLLCKVLKKLNEEIFQAPVILTGDFNSISLKRLPDEFDKVVPAGGLLSGVYELITKGNIPDSHPHHPLFLQQRSSSGYLEFSKTKRKKHSAEVLNKDLIRNAFEGIIQGHNLNLQDAYCGTEFPQTFYTNYTADFKGTIDYVFFSKDEFEGHKKLEVSAVLDGYQESILNKYVALPSRILPSDHISLQVRFILKRLKLKI